jgi:hypothetical protein
MKPDSLTQFGRQFRRLFSHIRLQVLNVLALLVAVEAISADLQPQLEIDGQYAAMTLQIPELLNGPWR